MKLKRSASLASGLFILLSAMFSILAHAGQAYVFDDFTANEVVMKSRAQQGEPQSESVKRAIFKIKSLDSARRAYEQDPVKALRLIGYPNIENHLNYANAAAVIREYKDPAKFYAAYAEQLKTRVEGQKFSDVPYGSAMLVAGSVAASLLTDGMDKVAIVGISAASGRALDYGIHNWSFTEPEQLGWLNDNAIHEAAQIMRDAEKNNPALRDQYHAILKRDLGLANPANAWTTNEMKSFTTDNELTALTSRHSQLSKDLSVLSKERKDFERSVELKVAHSLDLQTRAQQFVLEQMKQIQDQNADLAKRQAAQLKLDQAKREFEADSRAIQIGFNGLESLSRSLGASADTLRLIRNAKAATEALHTVTNKLEDNPWVLAGGYMTLASVAIDLFQASREQPDPTAEIIKAINQLAQQIDNLKIEVLARFDRVGLDLTLGFARQESLAQAILENQAGQALALERFKSDLLKSNDNLREIILGNAEFDRSLREDDCLPSGLNTRDQIRRCAHLGIRLANKQATDGGSVDNDFNGMFPPVLNKADLPERSFQQLTKDYARVIPVFNQKLLLRPTEIPNPMIWQEAAQVLIPVFARLPSDLEEQFHDDQTNILEQGRSIQAFYRNVFAAGQTEDKDKNLDGHKLKNEVIYKVDGSNVLRQFDRYMGSLQKLKESIKDATQVVRYPWNSVTQVLPYESYPAKAPQDGRAKSMAHAPTPPSQPIEVVNRSTVRLFDNHRGEFPKDGNYSSHKFLDQPVKLCPGVEGEWLDNGKNPMELHVAVQTAVADDMISLKGRGLKILDSSVLSLIPREALWLEYIEPSRFQIEACVSKIQVQSQSYPRPREGRFDGHYDFYDFENTMVLHLDFTIKDKYASAFDQLTFSSIMMRIKVQVSGENYIRLFKDNVPYRIITDNWAGINLVPGNGALGAKFPNVTVMGPIQNNLDKYFTERRDEKLDKARAAVAAVVGSLRESQTKVFNNQVSISGSAGDRITAAQELRILKSLRLLNYSEIPEVQQMFQTLDSHVFVTDPMGIQNMILEGSTFEEVDQKLKAMSFRVHKRIDELSGRTLDQPPKSPVDASVATLELIRETYKALPSNDR